MRCLATFTWLIPNDMSTLAMGVAGSMAQVLLCAGTTGRRFTLLQCRS